MANQLGVLIIHGMGTQEAGYSKKMADELSNRVGSLSSSIHWQEVYWANVLAPRENELMNIMQTVETSDGRVSLDWGDTRKFVVHSFGDALAYTRDDKERTTAYKEIHEVVDQNIRVLTGQLESDGPVIVMAHSLGAQIISNYLWDREHHDDTDGPDSCSQIDNLLSIITFGCNIPLFSLAFDVPKPITLPGKGMVGKAIASQSQWHNYFDRDDVLGWPLKPLYRKDFSQLSDEQKATVGRIVDHEISVGSIFSGWGPGSHSKYWTDNDFTKPVAEYIHQVFRAMNS